MGSSGGVMTRGEVSRYEMKWPGSTQYTMTMIYDNDEVIVCGPSTNAIRHRRAPGGTI